MEILDKSHYYIYKNTSTLDDLEFFIKLDWGEEICVFGYTEVGFYELDEIDSIKFNLTRVYNHEQGIDVSLSKELSQSVILLIEDNILNDYKYHRLDEVYKDDEEDENMIEINKKFGEFIMKDYRETLK